MKITIPKQLKYEEARFLRLQKKEKKPIASEQQWQEINFGYNDFELKQHLEEGMNYGIIGGDNKNLIIIDSDSQQVADIAEKFKKTFTVKTGGLESYKKHYYFFADKIIKPIRLSSKKLGDLGDVRSKGQYVVAPNSVHPSKNKYEVIKDVPITHITEKEIRAAFKNFIDPTEKTEFGEYPIETTKRSSEFIRSCKVPDYCLNNKLKHNTSKNWKLFPYLVDILHNREVAQSAYIALCKKQGHNVGAIKGWVKKAHEGKLMKCSCEKMREYLNRFHSELIDNICGKCQLNKKNDDEVDFEVYDYKDMMEYEPEPQSWLIEGQIPKEEVGLEVGKRGDKKTFTSLHQALCLASGNKVFGTDKVPERKKVLFIDDETGKNEIVRRVKMLSKPMKIKEDIDFKCVSFSGLKLDRKDMKFAKFISVIEEFKPDLIIVDSLQRCVTFEVDKDNAAISGLFTDTIRPIIKNFGCSWLFIHHLRKAPATKYKPTDLLDEVRGGSELVNYCRFILSCQVVHNQATDDNSDLVIFKVLKMSNSPIPAPKVISFTSNDDGLTVAYEGEPEEVLASEIQAANAIKEWILNKQMIEFQTKEVKEASEEIGFRRSWLDQGLKLLWNQGFLEKPKRGHWKVTGNTNQTKLKEEVN